MKNEKENENSEKQSFATSPVAVKRDKLIQTKFDKYAISAKTENIILRNENFKIITKHKRFSNPKPHEVVLACPENVTYFTGLSPALFWILYNF